jgi:hypothetical protein
MGESMSLFRLGTRTVAGALILTGLPAAAFAERPTTVDSGRADRVQLVYKYSRGQTASFMLELHEVIEPLSGQAQTNAYDINVALPFTQQVQSVNDQNVASLGTTLGELTMTVETTGRNNLSSVRDRLRGVRITSSIESDGTVVEQINPLQTDVPAMDPSGGVADLLVTIRPELPLEPVGIGDSWIQSTPLSVSTADGMVTGTLNARYTLAGYALYAGREVVVLDGTYESMIDGTENYGGLTSAALVGRGAGQGYILFDVSAGRVLEHGLDTGLVLTTTDASGGRAVVGAITHATIIATNVPAAEGSGTP